MGKKTSNKKPKKPKKLAVKREMDYGKGSSPDENEMDFGGLPERDLKKNLGCG